MNRLESTIDRFAFPHWNTGYRHRAGDPRVVGRRPARVLVSILGTTHSPTQGQFVMTPKSFAWACATILFGTTVVANAQVDLGEMLGSLTFGSEDPPSVAADPSASDKVNLQSQPQWELPNVDQLLDDQPAASDASAEAGLIGGSGLDDGRSIPQPPAELESELAQADAPPAAPPADVAADAAAQGESQIPQPPQGSGAVGSRVDFDAIFRRADRQAPTHISESAPVDHSQACDGRSIPVAVGVHAMPVAPVRHCAPEAVMVLRPTPCLEFPNLPPPVSAEGFYRTPACYRDLWSGYAAQKAHACQKEHKHLHGHCQCLDSDACTCGAGPVAGH